MILIPLVDLIPISPRALNHVAAAKNESTGCEIASSVLGTMPEYKK